MVGRPPPTDAPRILADAIMVFRREMARHGFDIRISEIAMTPQMEDLMKAFASRDLVLHDFSGNRVTRSIVGVPYVIEDKLYG